MDDDVIISYLWRHNRTEGELREPDTGRAHLASAAQKLLCNKVGFDGVGWTFSAGAVPVHRSNVCGGCLRVYDARLARAADGDRVKEPPPPGGYPPPISLAAYIPQWYGADVEPYLAAIKAVALDVPDAEEQPPRPNERWRVAIPAKAVIIARTRSAVVQGTERQAMRQLANAVFEHLEPSPDPPPREPAAIRAVVTTAYHGPEPLIVHVSLILRETERAIQVSGVKAEGDGE
jgi:hypothetical protein